MPTVNTKIPYFMEKILKFWLPNNKILKILFLKSNSLTPHFFWYSNTFSLKKKKLYAISFSLTLNIFHWKQKQYQIIFIHTYSQTPIKIKFLYNIINFESSKCSVKIKPPRMCVWARLDQNQQCSGSGRTRLKCYFCLKDPNFTTKKNQIVIKSETKEYERKIIHSIVPPTKHATV